MEFRWCSNTASAAQLVQTGRLSQSTKTNICLQHLISHFTTLYWRSIFGEVPGDAFASASCGFSCPWEIFWCRPEWHCKGPLEPFLCTVLFVQCIPLLIFERSKLDLQRQGVHQSWDQVTQGFRIWDSTLLVRCPSENAVSNWRWISKPREELTSTWNGLCLLRQCKGFL